VLTLFKQYIDIYLVFCSLHHIDVVKQGVTFWPTRYIVNDARPGAIHTCRSPKTTVVRPKVHYFDFCEHVWQQVVQWSCKTAWVVRTMWIYCM